MIRSFIALVASLLLCGATLAQTPQLVRPCVGTAANCTPVSATAPLPVSTGSGALASEVQGNSASGAADVGNPVKVGGVYNTTLPTFTNGQRAICNSIFAADCGRQSRRRAAQRRRLSFCPLALATLLQRAW